LQGCDSPDRRWNPTDERDLQNKAEDPGNDSAPEDKREEWKKYGNQGHLNGYINGGNPKQVNLGTCEQIYVTFNSEKATSKIIYEILLSSCYQCSHL